MSGFGDDRSAAGAGELEPAKAGLARLNALPAEEAEAELLACCGARAWARRMVDARPFGGRAELFERAAALWWDLGPDDWLEAFRAHPRIGERASPSRGEGRGPDRHARWAEQEQAGARGAQARVLEGLAEGNVAYEERFGHVFLICATGLGAAEMLARLRERMDNDPDTELRVAAEEQRRITRLRLEKLLTS